jgi:hypothetical protein
MKRTRDDCFGGEVSRRGRKNEANSWETRNQPILYLFEIITVVSLLSGDVAFRLAANRSLPPTGM